MGLWSKNNRACKTLWVSARYLKQYSEVFDDAGALKMRGLEFWKDDLDLRKIEAGALATQLSDMFRKLFGAKFEKDVAAPQAVEGMRGVLIEGNKTMADLAEKVDALFYFKGE
ncbi:MAG TPA: hypothetical protein VF950_21560 [Planctomycetota bacterium]